MYRTRFIVKLLPLALLVAFLATPSARSAETAPAQPYMMYFYNPSCRLCTRTNEVVAEAENKYKDSMAFQRFNIADPKEGTDNVLYMFDMLDVMQVPEDGETTLVVFIGLLETEDGEPVFNPKRVLVEGDEIIGKLDKEIQEFLEQQGKGDKSLGLNSPASFFFQHGPCRSGAA